MFHMTFYAVYSVNETHRELSICLSLHHDIHSKTKVIYFERGCIAWGGGGCRRRGGCCTPSNDIDATRSGTDRQTDGQTYRRASSGCSLIALYTRVKRDDDAIRLRHHNLASTCPIQTTHRGGRGGVHGRSIYHEFWLWPCTEEDRSLITCNSSRHMTPPKFNIYL